ncbi:MAG: hypothetical protein AAF570_14070 [Bacteroidota bacterium]
MGQMTWKWALRALILGWVGCMGLSGTTLKAQQEIGLWVGPGLQTIDVKEAVLTDGFKVAILPELGLRYRTQVADHFWATASLGWLAKGARISDPPSSIADSVPPQTFIVLQANYVNASVGLEARYDINDQVHVFGQADFAVGFLLGGFFRNTFYSRGDPLHKVDLDGFFRSPYLGVDIGGGIGFHLSDRIHARIAPVLELQLNRAYNSNVFIPKFVGFVPRFGLGFNLP